jgi:hypothetical protein
LLDPSRPFDHPSTTTSNAIDDARRRPIDDGSELSAENYYVAYVEAETQI